ncbi:hypothetical protein NUW54_g3661 [Trametes sanguinea]|uniref:Uncharacterized protein n=1 Tax=Trametes sanguinea TaxID=158606 RepID=A0ACC1Q3Q6_9APHY|nr:hypothetical protein NUW54_g3661 [Trametes sanguinea]
MAFQTSSSASTTSTSSSSQTPASGSMGMPPNLDGNSSLPFSFLITFIAVFLFFLGCGLGSRRVTRQLRRNLGIQVARSATISTSRLSEKPLLWDVYLTDPPSRPQYEGSTDRYAWENLSPLSATYVRAATSEQNGGTRPEVEPPPPPRWGTTAFLLPLALVLPWSPLNSQIFRFSVGGLTDVAEIKGHRRTYVVAPPSKIIQALWRIGHGHNGDPASALLEMLEPENNTALFDHYTDVPVNLSHVLFVCTDNMLETIPALLLDRIAVLKVSGYLSEEKSQTASKYLGPQAKEAAGLKEVDVQLDPTTIDFLIKYHCRESGIRNLKKHIDKPLRPLLRPRPQT